MDENMLEQQIKTLNKLWHELLHSNKINVCTTELESVTPLEVSILRVLGENPEIILREICQKLNVSSSTLTSAINRLEKRNLLYRTINNRDLRSFGLQLTEKGSSALSEYINGEEKIIEKMLHALENNKERSEFIRLFYKIVNDIIKDEQ